METLLHNFIQATGWSILHSLWQAALIYALLLPTQIQVFKLNARLKYALAYAAKCLMFLCFIFTFITIFQWPDTPHYTAGIAQIAYGEQIFRTAIPLTVSQYTESIFPYVVLLYGLGLIIQTFVVYNGYRKIQLLRKAAYMQIPGEWSLLFGKLKQDLNIRKHVDFRLSEHIAVPLVVGFLKPMILFPMSLATQIDMKHLEAILIHELSHIGRNDYFFNLIRTMIDTIMFFNPFVWLAGRFINIEREHACDDLVIKLTKTPLTYAHALLQLELLTDKNKPALALAATGNNQHLYQRIKRITDMKTNYVNSKQKLLAVTLTIATVISLAWINPVKSDKKNKMVFSKTLLSNNLLTSLIPQDTAKKKTKKTVRTKRVTAKKNYVTAPGVPAPPVDVAQAPALPTPPTAPGPPSPPLDITIPPMPPMPAMPDVPMPDMNVITDFAMSVKDMVIANAGNKKELEKMQVQIEKRSKELEKSFNSPEQQAKWKKYGEDMAAKFNSPEQQAKWKKYGEAVQAKYNSPEEREKWKKYAEDLKARFDTPEQRARLQKTSKSTYTFHQDSPVMVITKDDKIKKSPEYIELKKKFEKDLQELYDKNNKKESN